MHKRDWVIKALKHLCEFNRGRYSKAMSTRIPKTMAAPTTPCLDITISNDARPPTSDRPILTHLYFGDKSYTNSNCLSIRTGLTVLGSNLFAQYWFTDKAVEQRQYKHVQLAYNRQMLFGHIQRPLRIEDNLQHLTEQAYREVFECLRTTGCTHLLRTWNYFPEITKACPAPQSANRYESFCSGRLQAMRVCGIENKIYPAATVIGNQGNCLQIYFLASDTPGMAIENPRQTSAYHYPVEDAVTQPLFSRGMLKVWGSRTHFYVSGTASIVGHETTHIDDVGAQLNEAINNIETLVAHTNDQHQTQLNAQDDLLYMKVYLRHGKDTAHIEQILAARLSGTTPRILLLGDMCRDDLLVEIEAFYQA